MASHTSTAHRLLLVGGFAVAASAAPILIAVATPSGPASPALAQCPSGEVLDQASGACKPTTDKTPTTLNPVDPGHLRSAAGCGSPRRNPARSAMLPEVNGIPCQGDNTGLCVGLEQENAAKSHVPHVTTGVTG